MKYIFLFSCLVFDLIGLAQCPILPTPNEYRKTDGNLILNDVVQIFGAVPDQTKSFLSNELNNQFKLITTFSQEVNGTQIIFTRNESLPKNSYSLRIEDNVQIDYSTDESCFHAVNSLLQLVQGGSSEYFINKCEVMDKPKYEWRGLHLDVSRHFFSVDEIKRFLDLMSFYKFNVFHWHLTDDQGWRIEIKKYPKLTSVGAFRDSTVIGHYSDSPRKYDTIRYGGFYTQDEIKEIVNYAKEKYITVVPEIEMPGHSRAALAAYPELSCTGIEQPVTGLWGIFDDIYCSKKESIDFMKDVMAEVVELFPSEYIHVGGDEAPKTRWKTCASCQRVMKENDLKDEHELQSYFIGEMDQFLTARGRKLIGWDEILEGGLSPNSAVMSWRGEQGGIEAAKQKHNVVMSPTTYCYFDYYQSSHTSEPLAIGGYLPLEKVYAFNPTPAELSLSERNYILGGQANLWTEYIPNMKQLEYMTYPRALALIQSLWCENKPEYSEFLETYLLYHENYLSSHKVNFAKSIHYPQLRIERASNGIQIGFNGTSPNEVFKVSSSLSGFSDFTNSSVMKKDDIIFLEREKNMDLNVEVESEAYDVAVQYKFSMTSALGMPIELVTKPHPKYNHNGSLNLVDGIRGSLPWKGSEWLGFNQQKIEFIMNLEDEMAVSSLEIGFLEQNGSWIYLPEKVRIYISKNNNDWNVVGTQEVNKDEMVGNVFKALVNQKTRFIKVNIEAMSTIPEGKDGAGNVPWTFIDEVEIVK